MTQKIKTAVIDTTGATSGHLLKNNSGVPEWSALAIADVSGLSAALDAKLDDSQAGTFGLNVLGTATSAAATALFDAYVGATSLAAGTKGLVPASLAGDQTKYLRGDATWQTLDKATVGLGNVDNTSDANKPVSTAQQTALDAKANLAGATFTGSISATNFSGSSSGTNTGDQTITLTGDVTGSGTGSFAATVANAAITNAKLANMAAATLKGNNGGVAAVPADLTATQVTAMLNAYVGATASVAGTKGLVPAGAAGDQNKVLRGDSTWLTLATVATSGSATDLSAGTLAVARLPALTGGDVTSGAGSSTLTIGVNTVTLAKLAQVATATFLGRTTALTGDVEALTTTQATALLNALVGANGTVAGTKGLVPAPAATDNGKYLRGDATWQTLDKTTVGLGNVDNTSDANKPVSTAQQTALDAKINATEKGAASGVATLGADSKIPASQLPAFALTDVHVVATQAAQIALVAQEGDVAVRSDLNKSFIHNGGTAGTMADWQELLTPTDQVLSVNGYTGAVTLAKADVGLGNVDNTSDANKPVSAAQQTALDAKANLTGATFSGAISATNLSGTNTGDQTITLTGDVTGSGTGSFAATIAAGAVSNSKLTNMAAATLKGNDGGVAAAPADLTATQVTAMLNSYVGATSVAAGTKGLVPAGAAGDQNKVLRGDSTWLTLATVATSGSAADLSTGTFAVARLPALTGGDVTSSAGSSTLTIGNNTVTNAKLSQVATATFKGRATAATGNVEDLTATQATALLDLATTTLKGLMSAADKTKLDGVATGATANTGTVTSVSVTTANGVSGTVANATTTPAISLTLGAITPSSVAATGTVTGSNLSGTNTGDQTITLTGDVTGSGTGSFAATIAANSVTLAKLAQVPTATFLGRTSALTGDVEALTAAQATALLNTMVGATGAAAGTKGLVPAPAATDNTKLLRGDATFVTVDKTYVGLGNVEDKSSATIRGELTSANVTTALAFTPANKAGDTFSGFVTLHADPTSTLHAATKQYVDNVAQGLDVKASVRVASTANIALATGTLLTIDGITLVAGERVLVKNQTAPAENGIYVAAAGAWVRATDMDAWSEVPGAFVFVEAGTTQADTGWVCTSDTGGTLGTTAIAFTQFAGVGEYTASGGVTLSTRDFRLSNMAANTIKGNNTAGSAAPVDLTATQATAMLDLATTSLKGLMSSADKTKLDGVATGATANTGTVTSVSVTTANGVSGTVANATTTPAISLTLGAITPSSVASSGAVSGTTGSFSVATGTAPLTITSTTLVTNLNSDLLDGQHGSYYNDAANLTGSIAAARLPAFSGDVTTTAGTSSTTIANDAVTNAKLANMATATLKGRVTAATGDPEDLTGTQATSLLDALVGANGTVAGTKGLVPAPAATDNTKFLRGDATFVTVDKAYVGLGNVDNTSDANKPVSTATQTALDGKEGTITAGTTSQYWRGDKTFQTLNNAAVGLGNVENKSSATIRGEITSSNVTTALTFTPANKAGDSFSGFVTLHADPTSNLHAATKQYVDSVAQGLDVKASVRVASTTNIALATGTLLTIDGITLVAGDRVLVKNQTAAAENGIYIAAAGAWARATDMDAWAEVPSAFVFVESGTTQADTGWVCTSDAGGTLGTTAISFTQFAGVGEYTASGGVTLSTRDFRLSDMPANTLKGNNTAGTAAPTDLSASQVRTLLGLATVATSASAGDLTTGTLLAARMPALTGDVTTTAGTVSTTIASNVVSNAKLSQVATATFKGRTTAGTGNVEDLTATQATALLDIATTSLKGLMSSADKTKLDGVATGATANTGTVTSVSVTTANGVSGTVANATTTPEISLTLGAITPSTVTASGTVRTSGEVQVKTATGSMLRLQSLDGNAKIFAFNNAETALDVLTLQGSSISLIGSMSTTGTIRTTGFAAPSSGQGVEINYTGGEGFVLAYDRTTPGDLPLILRGSRVDLNNGGTRIASVTATGLDLTGKLHVTGDTILQTASGTLVSARGLNANYFSTGQALSLYSGTSGVVVLGPGTDVAKISSSGLSASGVLAGSPTTRLSNGTFADATGWTLSATSSIASGVITHTQTAAGVTYDDNSGGSNLIAGKTYEIVYDVTANNTTTQELRFYTSETGASYSDTVSLTVGTGKKVLFTPTTTGKFGLRWFCPTANTGSVSLDNITAIEIPTSGKLTTTGDAIVEGIVTSNAGAGNAGIHVGTPGTDNAYIRFHHNTNVSPGYAQIRGWNTKIEYDGPSHLFRNPGGGTQFAEINSSGLSVTGTTTSSNQFLSNISAYANPSYSFVGETGTGMLKDGANSIAFTTGGGLRARITSNGIQVQPTGSALTPAIRAGTDLDTGIYFPAADNLAITTGGAQRANFDSTGLSVTGTVTASSHVDVKSGNGLRLYNSANTEFATLLLNASNVVDVNYPVAVTGDVNITGALNATSKSFWIDHPTKPGKKLHHGSLEGPEFGVYVRGASTDGIIELPEYWTGLVDETTITVTLTSVGKPQKLYVAEIKDNKVIVKNGSWFSRKMNFHYTIYGERKDIPKLVVE